LCFVVENLIVGVGKDEDIIFLEVFRCESSRIGDGGGGHTQLPADLLQDHNAGRDILVDIPFAVFRVDKGTFPAGGLSVQLRGLRKGREEYPCQQEENE